MSADERDRLAELARFVKSLHMTNQQSARDWAECADQLAGGYLDLNAALSAACPPQQPQKAGE